LSNKLLSLAWGLKPCGSPSDRLLLAALADHADDSGKCWPGIDLLRAETELSARTITRSLEALAARDWIAIQRKAVGALHRNSAYTLNKARLQAEQRTPVTMTLVRDSTSATLTDVQASNEPSSPVTMTPALEPPLTSIGTVQPFVVVPKKIGERNQRVVPPFALEEFIPADAWEDFEQHRIRKGKPLDDGTRWAAQKRLRRFHGQGQDVREIIENTIISGWQGLFPATAKPSRDAAPVITNPVQALDKIRRVS